MTRHSTASLFGLTQRFFHEYLQRTRGESVHTVRAYRDALKLFFCFAAQRKRAQVAQLTLDDIQAEVVLAFLEHVESGGATRQRHGTADWQHCAALHNICFDTMSHEPANTAASS